MTERPASDGREGYGAHPDEVDVRDDAEIANFGLIGHKTENLLGKIHPGPHHRWGAPDGAFKNQISGVPESPQAFWGEEGWRND
ncbi:MAG: hypothetical protein ACLRIN_07045 [Lawsonibacter sp.]